MPDFRTSNTVELVKYLREQKQVRDHAANKISTAERDRDTAIQMILEIEQTLLDRRKAAQENLYITVGGVLYIVDETSVYTTKLLQ